MSIRHHPDDATLMSYAAGAVPDAFGLAIAAHLEQCPRCRERVDVGCELGGGMLDRMPAESMAEDALACVMARLEVGDTAIAPTDPASVLFGLIASRNLCLPKALPKV